MAGELIPAGEGGLVPSQDDLAKVAQEWLRQRLAGVDVGEMFTPIIEGVYETVDPLKKSLAGLVGAIENGTIEVWEALVRLARVIGRGPPGGGGPPRGSAAAGGQPADTQGAVAAGILQAAAVKFAAVIAPLATFGAILSQANSGFSLVTGALQILAATVAPLLLPFFVLLAAGLLTVSDMLWSQLLPNLKDWYTLVLNEGVPAMTAFIQGLAEAAKGTVDAGTALSDFVDRLLAVTYNLIAWVSNKLGDTETAEQATRARKMMDERIRAREKGEPVPDAADFEARERADRFGGGGGGEFGGDNQAGGKGGAAPGGDVLGKLLGNMDLVIQQLKFTQGSKASFSGLAEAAKQAQMAAFKPPFERIQEQRTQQAITLIEQVVAELRNIHRDNKPGPAVGPGGG